jgi:hypothetical protein
MTTNKGKSTKNIKSALTNETPESKLGFLPDYIEDATVGDVEVPGKKYIYRKLDKPLEIQSNNSKRALDVYISSAEEDDLNQLLNYLLPKKKE